MMTFLGLDVSRDVLDLHVRPTGQVGRFSNTPDGHRQLLAALPPRETIERIVLEATGGLEGPVAATLAAAGYPVVVVNPRQVRDFAKAAGQLAKTDALDAAVLAHFADALRPELRPLPPADLQEFRELLDRREQLLQNRTAESNRLVATLPKVIRTDLEAHLAWLEKHILAIEAKLNQRIAANLHWKATEELLRSIPGLGPQTARMLIGHLPELGRLDRRQLASLVGLAPMNCDSGKSRGVRRIVGGRAAVRKSLYMAAFASTRHNPVLAAFYVKLRRQGKQAKVAFIACARKLLSIANAVIRTKTPWRQPPLEIS